MNTEQDNFIMLPTVDFCFKKLMNNPKVRKGFIAALLKQSPEEIQETILLPTILRKDFSDDKIGILDVRVKLKNGAQIDFEMQVSYFQYWDKRVIFYLSKMYTEQLKEGEPYENLQKCIHVSILNFIHFPEDDEYYHIITFQDENTKKKYSDLLEIQILELKKLPADTEEDNEILNWMRFFNGKNREELSKMAKINEYLEEAYKTLEELSADELQRLEYETREKALKDYNSQMGSALKRGISQGIEQGVSQGLEQGIQLTKTIYKLSFEGKTEKEIAKACGISIEEVKQILA